MAYQTIAGVKGGSDSEAKLAALRLPSLAGKSFLDLGCNMGFFCRHAREQGATRIVGVDYRETNIAEARKLDPAGDYIQGDWFAALRNMPGTFDIIIHLSAFHYVEDQAEFLRLVHAKLAPGGILVLECGVVRSDNPRYIYTYRKVGFVRHVTEALLQQLLADFAYRRVGRSVDQVGDPVPRYVHHCERRAPVAMFVGGETRSGKSTFSRELETADGAGWIRMDELLRSLESCPSSAVAALIQDVLGNGGGVQLIGERVFAADLLPTFAEMIGDLVPNCYRLIVLDGQIFTDGRIRQAVANRLMERGFVCWEGARTMSREVVTEAPAGQLSLFGAGKRVKLTRRAFDDTCIRVRPVDREVFMRVHRSRFPSAVCWEIAETQARLFECALRADAKSSPLQFRIEAFTAAELPEQAHEFADVAAPLASATRTIEGGDRFTMLRLPLPAVDKPLFVRIAVTTANAKDPTSTARGFIADPRLIDTAPG